MARRTGSSRFTRQLGQRLIFVLPQTAPTAAPSGRPHRGQGIVNILNTNHPAKITATRGSVSNSTRAVGFSARRRGQ